MKHRLVVVGVVVATVLRAGPASAQAPVINSVVGTVANGSVITLNGTLLNNESKANWDQFFISNPNTWSFEGSNFSTDGYNQPGGDPGGVYDTSVRLLGNKSVKFRVVSSGGGCPGANVYSSLYLDPAGGDANDYWVRLYARWNQVSGWPNSHIKMIDVQGSGSQYYLSPRDTPNGTRPMEFSATYNSTAHPASIPSGQLENNRWYAVEVHWKTDTTPYVFDAWIDGSQVFDETPSSRGSLNYFLFGIINACGTSPFTVEHWMDGLAIGTSRIYPSAIVEVGNSPSYATATKKVQALEMISDSQISFKLNLTGLGSGPYYVWVKNNRQAMSNATSLVGGTSAPDAPLDLHIMP